VDGDDDIRATLVRRSTNCLDRKITTDLAASSQLLKR
jgi:hypothetical protein